MRCTLMSRIEYCNQHRLMMMVYIFDLTNWSPHYSLVSDIAQNGIQQAIILTTKNAEGLNHTPCPDHA